MIPYGVLIYVVSEEIKGEEVWEWYSERMEEGDCRKEMYAILT